MNKKLIMIIAIVTVAVIVVSATLFGAARFVFLAPSCYSDNGELTERENYFIKKVVLEVVEDRFSVFGGNGTQLFLWINSDFMETVTRKNDEYIIHVQTHNTGASSNDCIYEIHLSKDFDITFFGLDL